MESNNNPAPTEVAPEAPAEPVQPTETAAPPAPAEPTPAEPAPAEPKPAKSSKSLIWCLSILVIIAIAAAAVFAYLYFTNPSAPANPTPDSSQTSTEETETTEEVAITDPLVKKDLDEKVAILHGELSTEPTFASQYPNFGGLLFSSGDLPEDVRISNIAYWLSNYFSSPTDDEIKAIIADGIYTEEEINQGREYIERIDGELMREKYLEVFGEDITPNPQRGYSCPVHYNDKYDIFYQGLDGCGGTSNIITHYYKNAYTTKDDNAYVYVSVADYNLEDNNIYCDFYTENNTKICGTATDRDDVVLNETNYKDYAQYRIVFKKSDAGTYYFVKTEKF
ncbi:hypothetical protein IKF67_01850 [Candidatus Saccharibacteria bacterium]|nr:hypothetical protein [Candidatus Saccharibacteria bacterium]